MAYSFSNRNSKSIEFCLIRLKNVLMALLVCQIAGVCASQALCDEIILKWRESTSSGISGYRIYKRKSGDNFNYSYPAWQGDGTQCEISGLDEITTYHFVARAYNASNVESVNSNSVSYEVKDSDNDGLSDYDEINIYSTDPLKGDTDGDGIGDATETGGCTDPADADSDDDGIIDGSEDMNQDGSANNGETNPCDNDSDDDGIPDGTEIGMTLQEISEDTDLNVFTPDLDPESNTDPLSYDTDNDGTPDGDEDSNRNGRLDNGESDPASDGSDAWNPGSEEIIIDNTDTGAEASGNWHNSGGEAPYGKTSVYSRVKGAKYTYSADISGSCQISLWWTCWESRAESVPVDIYDGNDRLKRLYINQKKGCGVWNQIGEFTFTGNAGIVIISNYSEFSTCADAVKIRRLDADDCPGGSSLASVTIDNGENGTSSDGSWKKSGGDNPYGAISLYSREKGARYSYASDLSGYYNVSLWWTGWHSRSESVPVEIFDGNSRIDTVHVNQKQGGGQWNDIGRYKFNGKAKVSVISNDISTSTCADAVRFDPSD